MPEPSTRGRGKRGRGRGRGRGQGTTRRGRRVFHGRQFEETEREAEAFTDVHLECIQKADVSKIIYTHIIIVIVISHIRRPF